MQVIAVLAVLGVIVNIVSSKVFPNNAVWEFLDLRKVMEGLPKEAKKEYRQIDNDMTLTLAQRKQKKMEWAEKFGVKPQYTDFVKKRVAMLDKTAELLASLPKLFKQYRDTWDGKKLFKDIEAELMKLAAKYKKEYSVMSFAKDLVEREGRKIYF
ncbi:unnamed protein product [Cylicostephanus goldi]|uniref:SXP/RAL-2 family protein Ani s 5-like cation-binding domain-containing protein n=1 Tax=Cylicostephanus goldi TaxID=71465 RepID=A0A3P6QYF8_CYLGO|nr:unnamed protein product [Cylicostephanus goldi]